MAKTYRVGLVRRIVNAIVSMLVGRGRGPANTYVLTTMGRHSGQPRSTPVTLMVVEGDRFLVAPYGEVGWVHNIRARPVATLSRGATSEQVKANPVNAEGAAPILKLYLTELESVVRDYFDVSATDPVERFVAVSGRHPVFRLDPV